MEREKGRQTDRDRDREIDLSRKTFKTMDKQNGFLSTISLMEC